MTDLDSMEAAAERNLSKRFGTYNFSADEVEPVQMEDKFGVMRDPLALSRDLPIPYDNSL
jgi:hypothetical protein